ncbi:MAG: LytR/AlgR family response regulator transcription factor [Peptostreptococcaceae bacterium]
MIKIGLCDDNNLHLNELYQILNSISKDKNISVEILKFNSGEDLINFNKKRNNYFDIIFLDVLMNGINGIDTAKYLNLMSPDSYIVFVTVSKEYALDSYDVNAYSYILKPFNYIKLETIFLNLINNIINNKKNIIYVKNNQDIYSLNLNNIIYFESSLRKLTAYSLNNEITFYEKLSVLENKLTCRNFIRCHRSYLVNIKYIKNIVSSDIVTTTGHTIPISKKYLKSIRNNFLEYIQSNF